MNNAELIITSDGSHSLFVPELNEHYHSIHGAVQESLHVFIRAGLNNFSAKKEISILEMGFGTGLNALLTLTENKDIPTIHYDSLEAHPLPPEITERLNFATLIDDDNAGTLLKRMHEVAWDVKEKITEHFFLTKISTSLQCFVPYKKYDLIYFDAFAPAVQPELWTKEIFDKMFGMLNDEGILVTYCAKGEVKRNMKAAGFVIEALPGPKGKREMTRGKKV